MLNTKVKKEEAEEFLKVSKGYKTFFVNALNDEEIKSQVKELENTLREFHIDEELQIKIGGSYRKGTYMLSSDMDLVIDTPNVAISRAQVEEITRKLEERYNNVHLKKFAIECKLPFIGQIDLVFKNTLEHGKLPGEKLINAFENNQAAQNAARMLKFTAKQAISSAKTQKVLSFAFEILVIEVQRMEKPGSNYYSDGSMQLFISVLQYIVDQNGRALNAVQEKWFNVTKDKLDGIRGRNFDFKKEKAVYDMAFQLIHTFSASRIYNKYFNKPCRIEHWVRRMDGFKNDKGSPFFETPIGKISWFILGYVPKMLYPYHFYDGDCVCDDCKNSPISIEQCRLQVINSKHQAHMYLKSKFGKYTYNGRFLLARKNNRDNDARTIKNINKLYRSNKFEDAEASYSEEIKLIEKNENYSHSKYLCLLYINRSLTRTKLKKFNDAKIDLEHVVSLIVHNNLSVFSEPLLWFCYKTFLRLGRIIISLDAQDEDISFILKWRNTIAMYIKKHFLNKNPICSNLQLDFQRISCAVIGKVVSPASYHIPEIKYNEYDISKLHCRSDILFKHFVILVDKNDGYYKSLKDAINAMKYQNKLPHEGVSIVMMPGTYEEAIEIFESHFRSKFIKKIQIIGEIAESKTGRVILRKKNHKRHIFHLSVQPGQHIEIILENLKLENQGNRNVNQSNPYRSHSIFCQNGICNIKNCVIISKLGSGASCATQNGGRISLEKCRISGPASAVLVHGDGFANIIKCSISGCQQHPAIEIRYKGSSAKIKNSIIKGCSGQGLTLYEEGDKAVVESSTFENCGSTQKACIMGCSGILDINECKVIHNKHDGIVLQPPDEQNAHLICRNTLVKNNGNNGISCFGGKCEITHCTLLNNYSAGILYMLTNKKDTSPVKIRKNLTFKDNKVIGNDQMFKGNKNMAQVCLSYSGKQHKIPMKFPNIKNNHGTVFYEVSHLVGKYTLDSLRCSKLPKIKLDGCVNAITGKYTSEKNYSKIMKDENKKRINSAHYFQKAIDIEITALDFDLSTIVSNFLTCYGKKSNVGDNKEGQYSDLGITKKSNQKVCNNMDLKPCSIVDLISTFMRPATGKYLQGFLCAEPMKRKGLYTLITDKDGYGVQLGLYNTPQSELKHWNECFPKGTEIRILEPFLKRSADGGLIIRVDDPKEFEILSPACRYFKCHKVSMEKKEGEKERMKLEELCKQIDEADHCYWQLKQPIMKDAEYDEMKTEKAKITHKLQFCVVQGNGVQLKESCPKCKDVYYCDKRCLKLDKVKHRKKYHKTSGSAKKR